MASKKTDIELNIKVRSDLKKDFVDSQKEVKKLTQSLKELKEAKVEASAAGKGTKRIENNIEKTQKELTASRRRANKAYESDVQKTLDNVLAMKLDHVRKMEAAGMRLALKQQDALNKPLQANLIKQQSVAKSILHTEKKETLELQKQAAIEVTKLKQAQKLEILEKRRLNTLELQANAQKLGLSRGKRTPMQNALHGARSMGQAMHYSGAFEGELGKFATALPAAISGISSLSLGFAGLTPYIAATTAAMATAIAIFAQGTKIQQTLAGIQAVTGATDVQLNTAANSAMAAASAFGVLADDVLKANLELSKLGFNADTAARIAPQITKFSKAVGADTKASAELIGEVLHMYKLSAAETSRVGDLLANSVSSSALDFEKIAGSMKYVGSIAGNTNVTLEETTATLATMANQGVNSSRAGTAARTMMLRLGDATSKVSKRLKKEGIPVTAEFSEKLESLADMKLSSARVKEYFGQYASTGALALLSTIRLTEAQKKERIAAGETAASYRDLMSVYSDVSNYKGTVQSMAETTIDTFSGKFDKLGETIRNTFIKAFSFFDNGGLMDSLDQVTEWWKRNEHNILGLMDSITEGFGAVFDTIGSIGSAFYKALVTPVNAVIAGLDEISEKLGGLQAIEIGNNAARSQMVSTTFKAQGHIAAVQEAKSMYKGIFHTLDNLTTRDAKMDKSDLTEASKALVKITDREYNTSAKVMEAYAELERRKSELKGAELGPDNFINQSIIDALTGKDERSIAYQERVLHRAEESDRIAENQLQAHNKVVEELRSIYKLADTPEMTRNSLEAQVKTAYDTAVDRIAVLNAKRLKMADMNNKTNGEWAEGYTAADAQAISTEIQALVSEFNKMYGATVKLVAKEGLTADDIKFEIGHAYDTRVQSGRTKSEADQAFKAFKLSSDSTKDFFKKMESRANRVGGNLLDLYMVGFQKDVGFTKSPMNTDPVSTKKGGGRRSSGLSKISLGNFDVQDYFVPLNNSIREFINRETATTKQYEDSIKQRIDYVKQINAINKRFDQKRLEIEHKIAEQTVNANKNIADKLQVIFKEMAPGKTAGIDTGSIHRKAQEQQKYDLMKASGRFSEGELAIQQKLIDAQTAQVKEMAKVINDLMKGYNHETATDAQKKAQAIKVFGKEKVGSSSPEEINRALQLFTTAGDIVEVMKQMRDAGIEFTGALKEALTPVQKQQKIAKTLSDADMAGKSYKQRNLSSYNAYSSSGGWAYDPFSSAAVKYQAGENRRGVQKDTQTARYNELSMNLSIAEGEYEEGSKEAQLYINAQKQLALNFKDFEKAQQSERMAARYEMFGQMIAGAQKYYSTVTNLANTYMQMRDLQYQREIKQIDDKYKRAMSWTDTLNKQGMLTDRAAERRNILLEKNKEEAKKKAFQKEKKFKKAQIVLNTAQAIMGTWAGYAAMGLPGMIAASAQTAMLAGLATVQMNMVDSQKYANGGMPRGANANVTMNEHGQEGVLNASAMARMGSRNLHNLNKGYSSDDNSENSTSNVYHISYSPTTTYTGSSSSPADIQNNEAENRRKFSEMLKDTNARGYDKNTRVRI